MQTATVKTLGFKGLTKSVPDSADEFDKLAKQVGACVNEANKNVIYRSTLADFRPSYLNGSDEEKDASGAVVRPAIEGLDKRFGIARKTKVTKPEVKDAEGKVTSDAVEAWDETEDEFFTRLCAELAKRDGVAPEAVQAGLESDAQRVLDLIPFDPSQQARKSSGPKKTPATYVEIAKAILEANGGDLPAAIAKFNGKNIVGTTLATDATFDALAAAVWKDQAAKKKQISDQYSA